LLITLASVNGINFYYYCFLVNNKNNAIKLNVLKKSACL
jgi:hypothetical protein